jgi:2',3'-cyclic-nucleotide 2'-phosphodiesterase/3'-nucleotidase/5'-nucleotidase
MLAVLAASGTGAAQGAAPPIEGELVREAGPAGYVPIDFRALRPRLLIKPIGTYRGGYYSSSTPGNPPAYDPFKRRLYVGSDDRRAIEVLDIRNPSKPVKVDEINLTPWGAGKAHSLGIKSGVLAVTVGGATDSAPGLVLFFNQRGELLTDPIELPTAGRVRWAKTGWRLLVTQPGYPSDDFAYDAETAVTIIDFTRWPPQAWHQQRPRTYTIDFARFNGHEAALEAVGIRNTFGPNANRGAAVNLEIEDIELSTDPRYAWVTLERNNAVAKIDLVRQRVAHIFSLGVRDHSQPGFEIDASDRDGINIVNWPIKSLPEADGIAEYRYRGRKYIVTANEGDPRDEDVYTEKVRVRNLTLDPAVFPNAAFLQSDDAIGRLNATRVEGDPDGDGDRDELFVLGSRSFSVYTDGGTLVYDSGSSFEAVTAAALRAAGVPNAFNSPEDKIQLDDRSDDRGPEPEHLVLATVRGRTYVFIGFERIGGIISYDITDPNRPEFQQYFNNRNFGIRDTSAVSGVKGTPELPTAYLAGDLEPDGMFLIPPHESPIDVPILVVLHELSNTTTLYRLDPQ